MAPQDCADVWWHEMEDGGWIDVRGRHVTHAFPAFKAYAANWKYNTRSHSPTAYQPNKPPGNGWGTGEDAPWATEEDLAASSAADSTLAA